MDLKKIVSDYTIKYDRKIKQICAPLNECLGLSVFEFYTIDGSGNFGILSTNPEQLDFYYSEKLYLFEPYLRHPQFFRSGCTLIPAVADPFYQEICSKNYKFDHLFLKIERQGETLEGFLLGALGMNKLRGLDVIPHLKLLEKFIVYFKSEMKDLIGQMKADHFNLKKAKREAFFKPISELPLAWNPPESKFLKMICPLSKREQECLELFKQGETAQSTAALLGLSSRTVEYYFTNIKNKLNCYSKRELMNY